jgi:predicted Rossmann fold nucleotide-binding protein DprA/Smf involved in DNA uptake
VGKDTLRVAIVGSRKYENRRKIKEFIYKLKTDKGADTIIVSGGCKTGADYYAKKYALELGLQYQEFPPQHEHWNLYCPKDKKDYNRPYSVKNYYVRNKIIAAYSEYVVSFVPRGVESKGSMSTIKYANKFGKKTLVIN